MLISRQRMHPGTDARTFLEDVIAARRVTAEISGAPLVTADRRLRNVRALETIW